MPKINEISINAPVKILDDPDYCYDWKTENHCSRLDEDNVRTVFNKEVTAISLDSRPDDDFDVGLFKLDICKKAYQLAKKPA